MKETSNIVPLQSDEIDHSLTNVLRAGARQLLAEAVEVEVEAFLATVNDLKLGASVRVGYICRLSRLKPLMVGSQVVRSLVGRPTSPASPAARNLSMVLRRVASSARGRRKVTVL